jgi:hypothetical protein
VSPLAKRIVFCLVATDVIWASLFIYVLKARAEVAAPPRATGPARRRRVREPGGVRGRSTATQIPEAAVSAATIAIAPL